MECDFENTIVCLHRKGQNNKMFRKIYKAVETETKKVRITKVKRGREKVKRREKGKKKK